MTAFEKDGKTSLLKQNSERKQKLSNRDRVTLTWIVRKDHKSLPPKIIADPNDQMENPTSSKAVKREQQKAGILY